MKHMSLLLLLLLCTTCAETRSSFVPVPGFHVHTTETLAKSPDFVAIGPALSVATTMEMNLTVEHWVKGEKQKSATVHTDTDISELTFWWGPGEYRILATAMGYHPKQLSVKLRKEDKSITIPNLLPYEIAVTEGYVFFGQHNTGILVDTFHIDTMEVSFYEYQLCVDHGECETLATMNDHNFYDPDKPVVGASWYDAFLYCQWQEKRLPTIYEWERAARGDDARIYPWGEKQFHQPANYANSGRSDGFISTAPVDSFREGASPFGVLNMAGNAYEWVGNTPMPTMELKGGSWKSNSEYIKIWVTRNEPPERRSNEFGFRCAGSVE